MNGLANPAWVIVLLQFVVFILENVTLSASQKSVKCVNVNIISIRDYQT